MSQDSELVRAISEPDTAVEKGPLGTSLHQAGMNIRRHVEKGVNAAMAKPDAEYTCLRAVADRHEIVGPCRHHGHVGHCDTAWALPLYVLTQVIANSDRESVCATAIGWGGCQMNPGSDGWRFPRKSKPNFGLNTFSRQPKFAWLSLGGPMTERRGKIILCTGCA